MTTSEEEVKEQRRSFRDAFRDNSRSKDKILVSLAGAALGVSVAFLADFTESHPNAVWLLIVAWVGFTTSLVLVLLSHEWTSRQILRGVEYIDEWLAEDPETRGRGPKDGGYYVSIGERRYRVLDILDSGSVYVLILAFAAIITFLGVNV